MSFQFRPAQDFTRIVDLTPALRRQIEMTVEHLISILDMFDGDEDLEGDASDEPSLGWICPSERIDPLNFARDDRGDDREDENEHGGNILDEAHDDFDIGLEDGGDNEPSLGW